MNARRSLILPSRTHGWQRWSLWSRISRRPQLLQLAKLPQLPRLPLRLLTLLPFLCTGCAIGGSKSLYQWGSYEDQVYAMYAEPGKVSPQEQILTLEADADKARASNRALPPGMHAHLGYLYFQSGKPDRAVAEFETESRLFPESRPYMERLIARTTAR